MFTRRDREGITAVVLTTGEATTAEAVESLRRQSSPLEDIQMVENVRPFHHAMNAAVTRVRTPWMLQVDADMILDPDAVSRLREAAGRRVGMVVARLRDAMMDQVVGIKLYRTSCLRRHAHRDSVSTETDLMEDIERDGWEIRHIGRDPTSPDERWNPVGDHRPDYTPAYTYRKHLMEGSKYRHRGTLGGFRWRLDQLSASAHPCALLAWMGIARGLFLESDRDLHGRHVDTSDFDHVFAFMESPGGRGAGDPPPLPTDRAPWHEWFAYGHRLGRELGAAGDARSFEAFLRRPWAPGDPLWVAKVGLCRGLFSTPGSCDEDANRFWRFVGTSLQPLTTWRESAGTPPRPAHLPPPAAGNLVEEARTATIHAYALRRGLDRFVLAGPRPVELRAERDGSGTRWRETGRPAAWKAGGDRSRLDVPPCWGGHVVCLDAAYLEGIRWCLDLLRRGYRIAHFSRDGSPHRVNLLRQLFENIRRRLRAGSPDAPPA